LRIHPQHHRHPTGIISDPQKAAHDPACDRLPRIKDNEDRISVIDKSAGIIIAEGESCLNTFIPTGNRSHGFLNIYFLFSEISRLAIQRADAGDVIGVDDEEATVFLMRQTSDFWV
jgi:hypothetical protein